MKTFAIGDIHGCYEALKQVLERSKFDYNKDRLIVLGDICDGWPYVKDCFNELLKIKNLVCILGNHDDWALDWYSDTLRTPMSMPDNLWTSQGGNATRQSYNFGEMNKAHVDLLENAKSYYIEKVGKEELLFTHGGILENETLENMTKDVFTWDRDMFNRCVNVHPVNPDFRIHDYKIIFIGHTAVNNTNKDLYFKKHGVWLKPQDTDELYKPLRVCNVWNLDTGVGWYGKLTMMNIETEEYWQSDTAKELYPNVKGRV